MVNASKEDIGGIDMGCVASQPARAPTYASYIKDTHLAGNNCPPDPSLLA
jgi:hypothetical protein